MLLFGQLVCVGCRKILSYPLGSISCCCRSCGKVNAAQNLSLDCGGCGQPILVPINTLTFLCPCCATVTDIPEYLLPPVEEPIDTGEDAEGRATTIYVAYPAEPRQCETVEKKKEEEEEEEKQNDQNNNNDSKKEEEEEEEEKEENKENAESRVKRWKPRRRVGTITREEEEEMTIEEFDVKRKELDSDSALELGKDDVKGTEAKKKHEGNGRECSSHAPMVMVVGTRIL